jgi:hypothetical protein
VTVCVRLVDCLQTARLHRYTNYGQQMRLCRNGLKRPVLKHGPRSLTCVRVFEWQTRARNESVMWDPSRGHHGPILISLDRFESEHKCWDPKDGELCLDRMKPEETLVEVRSRSDVQIDGQIWA